MDQQPVDRSPEAIAARLRAILHIPIEVERRNQKYYGLHLDIGDSEMRLWHCSRDHGDDRKHVDHDTAIAEGWDQDSIADLYCDSHYESKADERMGEFLNEVKRDLAALLEHHGIVLDVDAAEEAFW